MIVTRRKNRRKQCGQRRWRMPTINWRRWVATAASLAGLAGAVGIAGWILDQPIERVDVSGRFHFPIDLDAKAEQGGCRSSDLPPI